MHSFMILMCKKSMNLSLEWAQHIIRGTCWFFLQLLCTFIFSCGDQWTNCRRSQWFEVGGSQIEKPGEYLFLYSTLHPSGSRCSHPVHDTLYIILLYCTGFCLSVIRTPNTCTAVAVCILSSHFIAPSFC